MVLKCWKSFFAKNAILEDILRVISRLRLGCNKCQIKCYEHVPWHSVWKSTEKSHFRRLSAKIEFVHEWLAFKSIFFISGVHPRLSWTLKSSLCETSLMTLKTQCISKTSFCSGMKVLSAFANAIGHLSYFRLRDKSAEIQSTFLQFVVV